jgi:hypothetical protein
LGWSPVSSRAGDSAAPCAETLELAIPTVNVTSPTRGHAGPGLLLPDRVARELHVQREIAELMDSARRGENC